MNVKIIVASHKPYEMPGDEGYLPVLVGAALANYSTQQLSGWMRDDEGENISDKNPTFCELTGLYWAWKNLDADAIGLAHYRRHFGKRGNDANVLGNVITADEVRTLLASADVLVPRKRHYYIETLESHYSHSHDGEHLRIARETIESIDNSYLPYFDKVMKQRGGYMFNMFVMKRKLLGDYCEFLFPILEEMEKRIDVSELSKFDARLFGRVSELLFNVWLQKAMDTSDVKIKEVPYFYVEKVNWFKKGGVFLAAKFGHKKYEGSF